jgi:Asp-tRNA(Asn)/Glu-tRNA(Gln) amidotransferase A subunit family amidase
MMKALCVPELFDTDLNVPPLPFDEKAYMATDKLKLGYFKTDRWFQPCAATQRGIDETVAALEEAGHSCIPFDIPTDGWDHYKM